MKEALIEAGKSLAEALLIVAIIVSVAYAATGTWHIGFAVESGSMEPNMHVGDLILVQAPLRTNITTYEAGKALNYTSFNNYGDVIIYRPNGFSSATPNQPMLGVEPVKPEWVIAVARVRIPYLGYPSIILKKGFLRK